jgi:hypothetical protein
VGCGCRTGFRTRAGIVDDIAVVRSCVADGINHSGGVCQMNTGSVPGRPAVAGGVGEYGLGTGNQNLPAFVVLTDTSTSPLNARATGAPVHAGGVPGHALSEARVPIEDLRTPAAVGEARQRAKLRSARRVNRQHADARPAETTLKRASAAYELAFRMQSHAPEAVDPHGRNARSTRALYGMDDPTPSRSAATVPACPPARRRAAFGSCSFTTAPGMQVGTRTRSSKRTIPSLCAQMDKPVAGLIRDLKSRGLLDETLVIWGGEFGRTPMSEKGDGRDHNPTALPCGWPVVVCRVDKPSARPTNWACGPSTSAFTSTTCTRRSST